MWKPKNGCIISLCDCDDVKAVTKIFKKKMENFAMHAEAEDKEMKNVLPLLQNGTKCNLDQFANNYNTI